MAVEKSMGMVWKRMAGVVLVATLSGLGGACAHPARPGQDELSISVEHSGLPETYAPMVVVWHITWWDGATVKMKTLPEQRAVDPVRTTLPLHRSGAEVIVVQATAEATRGGTLAPLGVWGAPPQSRLTLGPPLGRAAEAVLHAARRGLDPALINLERLQRTILEECEGEPETLDQQRLLEGLGGGDMTRYAVRRRARPGCEISLPASEFVSASGSDAWISHDPTEEIIDGVWADDRCYWVIPVAQGEVRHLWQWVSPNQANRAAAADPATPDAAAGTTDSAPAARLLTVGRDHHGHAFWVISPPR